MKKNVTSVPVDGTAKSNPSALTSLRAGISAVNRAFVAVVEGFVEGHRLQAEVLSAHRRRSVLHD
jgi:hypothetical protein